MATRATVAAKLAYVTLPICVECGGPCDKPFGWFVVERWEGGRVVARGHVCCAGCLIATAHSQRDDRLYPPTRGALEPVVDERVIEPGE